MRPNRFRYPAHREGMSSSKGTTKSSTARNSHICLCKWYDTKKGYGFLTVLNGPMKGDDVFVHFKALVVGDEVRARLTAGEYVSCEVTDPLQKGGRVRAANVTGVLGGLLLCETTYNERQRRAASHGPASDEGDEDA